MSTKYPGGFIVKNPTAPTNAAAKGIWTLNQAAEYTKQGIWPRIPGAPTIGTATATSYATATVAFTAPTNLGAGTITYTATSSPGGLTGTGASSPVTVSGLSGETSYTFTVTASTPGGTGPASAASNSITTPAVPPTVIGQAFGGGFYAGQIGISSVATHYIVVGPLSTAQSGTTLQWKTSNTSTAGTSSVIDGPTNSSNMNNASHPAAQFCESLTVGGFSDWYLPAQNELEVCYFNLKPTTSNNSTGGININAVPERTSNYTSGTPAQTSAAAFKSGGSEAFAATYYWSSTELSSATASRQYFLNGSQDFSDKTYLQAGANRVRAIRRVPV